MACRHQQTNHYFSQLNASIVRIGIVFLILKPPGAVRGNMNNLIITWTQEKKDRCAEIIEKWLQKHDAHSGEMIMQDDDCQIYASVLISNLVDDVIKPQYKDNY